MNSQSWAKTVTQNRKKCERILSISKDIRYAGVFNEYGRTISGKIQIGIKPIFSPNSVREEFFAIASAMRLRKKSAKGLGTLEFILIKHKKLNVLLFYKNGFTFYITIQPNTKLTPILINKIKNLVNHV